MKYRVFNISRTSTSPGTILQWTDDKGGVQQINPRPPHNWRMINELSERFFGWQAKGWLKVEPMDNPLQVMQDELAKKQIPAIVNEVKIGEDIGDEDLGYPDFNTGGAVEAELPKNAQTLDTSAINQETHQKQGQGKGKKKGNKGRKSQGKDQALISPSAKSNAKASVMGAEPTKAIDKGEEFNALNPLLDEPAKNVDNSSDSFVAKAPDRSSYQRGTTIS